MNSRGKTILKLAAAAGFASIALGLCAPSTADASDPTATASPTGAFALAINEAVLDFGRADKLTIRCSLTGVLRENADGSLAGPADFRIDVTVVDLRIGGASHSASQPPTVVR